MRPALSLIVVELLPVVLSVQLGVWNIPLEAKEVPKLQRPISPGRNLPLRAAFSGIELQYIGTVQVGNPPQNFSVAFDTGSVDLLLPSTGCVTGCKGRKSNAFDSTKSRSYVSTSKTWKILWGTGVGVNLTQEWCSGIVGQDTVSIAGFSLDSQRIGLITAQSDTLFGETGLEGIVGMGTGGGSKFGGTSWFRNLVEKGTVAPVFSFFIPPKYVGNNAQITIGGTDSSKYTGNINWLQVTKLSRWDMSWTITFEKITIGEKTIIKSHKAIADSGTSNMVAPKVDAEAIYRQISKKIFRIDEHGAYGMLCSDFEGLNTPVRFIMGNKTYTIPPKEFNVGPILYQGKPGYCQAFINSPTDLQQWIIGGSLLKYYYTIWDTGNNPARLGFATTAHSPPA